MTETDFLKLKENIGKLQEDIELMERWKFLIDVLPNNKVDFLTRVINRMQEGNYNELRF